jgi:hypothetical protein
MDTSVPSMASVKEQVGDFNKQESGRIFLKKLFPQWAEYTGASEKRSIGGAANCSRGCCNLQRLGSSAWRKCGVLDRTSSHSLHWLPAVQGLGVNDRRSGKMDEPVEDGQECEVVAEDAKLHANRLALAQAVVEMLLNRQTAGERESA